MSMIKELKADKIKFRNDFLKLVEITNLLGHKYSELGHYNEAVSEHLEAITTCKKIKNQIINWRLEAVSRRALGECYSEIGKHSEALEQHKLFLSLALQINDPIEIQRAHATIGRTYLLWGQEENEAKTNCDLLKKAQCSFHKALDLCEKLKSLGKLKSREYAEMKSRLLLNLGLVHESLHDFEKCKTMIKDAITLTKTDFLLDELFRCHISLGSIEEKTDCFDEAVHQYEEALKIAKTLKSRRKKYDAYISLGLVWMKQENIEKAKSYFKKAYYLNIPVEEDQERTRQFLKITMAIMDDQKKFSESNDLEEKISLCDRLGDHFVALKCFSVAIKFYRKELLFATEANKPDVFISKIYVSIGQTYLDDGKYQKAIEYFKHEYNFQLGNISEQCNSLLQIADIQECLYALTDSLDREEKEALKNEIIDNYETSLKLLDIKTSVKQLDEDQTRNPDFREKLKVYITTIKNYLSFLERNKLNYSEQEKLKDLLDVKSIAGELHDFCDDDNEIEISSDIYDQYDLDLLSEASNSSGDEEEIPENFRARPRRNGKASSSKNRLNQFGETPLHTACISGNIAQVEKLILQNVDINAKDFCGWTPLHEAANHGHLAIVEFLLKNGANIEACDDRSDRITPLHDACNCGHFDIIRLLINHNANVLAVNSNNETPLECLMSWRERTKNELNQSDIDSCLEFESEIMDLMKKKGFDLSNLFKNNKSRSDFNVSTNNNNNNQIIKKRNLVKDSIYSSENSYHSNPSDDAINYDDSVKARNEYKNTIESLRHFGSKSKCHIRSTASERQRALLDENEETPRDDWLIDDLNLDIKKKARKRNHEHRSIGSDSCKKLKSNDLTPIIDLESPEQSPIEDFSDLENETTSQYNFLMPHIESSNSQANKETKTVNSNSLIRNNSTKSKKALTINFDDIHKSSFMVFVENNSDCQWLKAELTRRYFAHYGMKPLFSLKTDNDAILLDSDLVIDIIENERTIKAVIDSWAIDQPDKRYVELCALQNAEIDRNIEASLRKSYQSSYLTFQGVFFPVKHQKTLMFKALLQQGIKELDLSFSNLLASKESYNVFRDMITSLPNLEELYLAGISFSSNCLIHLININLSLRKLDLSFNPLGDESTYSLAQIILTFNKLEYFNLSGCDLTKRFVQSNLLLNSIENSSLPTLILDYNDFPEDLIIKFKSLDINRGLIR